MAKLTRRLKRLMKQLGVPEPDEVFRAYEDDSELVAEETRQALERVLKEVQKASRSGALDGYEAVREKANEVGKIILPKSGFTISDITEWVIYVKPVKHHEDMDLSVFELIDQGRPEITKPGRYPLWGAEFLVNVSRNPSDVRPEPRKAGQKGNVPIVTVGGKNNVTLAPVPAKLLYDAALRRAKDQLSVKGLDRQWDVIKVGLD